MEVEIEDNNGQRNTEDSPIETQSMADIERQIDEYVNAEIFNDEPLELTQSMMTGNGVIPETPDTIEQIGSALTAEQSTNSLHAEHSMDDVPIQSEDGSTGDGDDQSVGEPPPAKRRKVCEESIQ